MADETTGDPDIRLAALVHRTRCAPADIADGTVSTAIDLLRRLTTAPQPVAGNEGNRDGSGACACPADAGPAAAEDVPPRIAAAFADLERRNRVHAPTTSLLRTFHAALDARLPERTALLTEQLSSPDLATRHDAIRMAQDLITSWRGDHTHLVRLLTECLLPGILDKVDDVRSQFIVALVAVHALAHHDLPSLLRNDLDRARGHLRVRRRGRLDHIVYLDELITESATAWLRERHRRWPRTTNPTCWSAGSPQPTRPGRGSVPRSRRPPSSGSESAPAGCVRTASTTKPDTLPTLSI
ncbi:hypothetical protein [Streptomyces mirabilis]|uniref:hypothetical protein n=1 Tax=Streptomyces mirabilis TaxID=68239 RepID=UPI0036CADDBB